MSGIVARMSTSAAGRALAPDLTGRPTRLRDVDLDTFFRPRSVAVIGASDSPRRPATNMWRKLRAWADAFGATVTPVNPKRTELDGLVCVPTIHDVPGGPVDLAVILVGDAVAAFEEVAAAKAKFAVIFGAGFAEVGGEGVERQRVLAELVEASDTHLLGPNTNLNAFETFNDANSGPALALITQSGHQGRPVFQSQDVGFAMSHWAPCGNEVDLEFADFAAWFAEQPTTGAIAAYVEGFKDGRTVQLAADDAMQRGVPIVAVKVGKTDEGAVDGRQPHRPSHRSRPGHRRRVPPVRHHPRRRPRRADRAGRRVLPHRGAQARASRRAPRVRLLDLGRHRRAHGRPLRRCRAAHRPALEEDADRAARR